MNLIINRTPSDLLATVAGAAGGVLGYWAFWWVAGSGFYALILPGGLMGVGAGLVAHRSRLVAIASAVAAFGLGLLTEYQHAPFVADDGLGYFVRHVSSLRGVTLVMTAAGAAIAFWGPFRSRVA